MLARQQKDYGSKSSGDTLSGSWSQDNIIYLLQLVSIFLACSLLIIVFSYVLMTAECSSTASRSQINNRISQTFASSSCPLVFYAYPPLSTFMYQAFSLQKELKKKKRKL